MSGGFLDEKTANFKGAKFYFNSYTLRGRFNWVAATYGCLFTIMAYKKLTKPAAIDTSNLPECKK